MSSAFSSLPDDVDSLKALVLEQAERNAQLTADNARYQARILTLTEQLNLALARRYAARSEKVARDQLRLFDEAESDVGSKGSAGEIDEDDADTVEVAAHARKMRGRRPLPDTLPRVTVIHELAEEERSCPHCQRSFKIPQLWSLKSPHPWVTG